MSELVFDIETQNLFGPNRDTRELKVSVVGVFDYAKNEFRVYEESELQEFFFTMQSATRIIGYNIKGFDLPVLGNYTSSNLLKLPALDLMEEVSHALGFRVKLDSLAQSTLGTKKSGDGLQAVEFWKAGKINELKKYCLDDVAITRDLYEYGKAHGLLKIYDRFLGGVKEIPVNFTSPKINVQAVNLRLF